MRISDWSSDVCSSDLREYIEDLFVFFATRNGTVKKTPLTEYAYRLQRGKIAINLAEGDALVNAELSDGDRDIMLFASNGKAVRFAGSTVRPMGRTATGVRGMRLEPGEEGCSLIVVDGGGEDRKRGVKGKRLEGGVEYGG